MPTIDVVVPSYGRPAALVRCLAALRAQQAPPDRVVVVARESDVTTRARLDEMHVDGLRVVLVAEAGLVAALRAGVAATTAEVVAFTDDDARPRPDWIARLLAWFARDDVGAVGGRDVQEGVDPDGAPVVGRLLPFGRMTGAHQLGRGAPRDVDVLKGVNLAVRADALVLPRRGLLADHGASPHVEVLVCEGVRRAGWRIVYDPAVLVDHDVLPRAGEHRIGSGDDRDAARATACNRIVAATVLERRRLPVELGYGLVVGTRESPGLVRSVAAAVGGERAVASRLPVSWAGQVGGAWRVCTRRGPVVDSCQALRSEA